MVIEVQLSAQWSKLNWDTSWEFIIDLEDLLPQVGRKYVLPITMNKRVMPIKMKYHNLKNGNAHFLWTPPHSELNGWYDTRPSEILNTFVVEGLVENRELGEESIDFTVLGLTRLTDVFERVDKEKHISQYLMRLNSASSQINWEGDINIRSAYINQYIYLYRNDGIAETDIELILSRESDKFCVHYSAVRCEYSDYSARITKCFPDKIEQILIESLLDKAEVVVDNSADKLTVGKIFGAEYQ